VLELVVGVLELVVGALELVVGVLELVVFAAVLVAELGVGLVELVVGAVELVVGALELVVFAAVLVAALVGEVTVSVAEDTIPVALERVDEVSAEALAAQIVLAPSARMLTMIARSLKVVLPIQGRGYPVRGDQTLSGMGRYLPTLARPGGW
jgi:hypothetical protein